MSAKHTPGPWKWIPGAQGIAPHAICEHSDKHGVGRRLADVHCGPDAGFVESTEGRANASLIAAAPDLEASGRMLNALLERMQEYATEYLTPGGGEKRFIDMMLAMLDGPDQRAAQSAHRAAIAKAEGA